MIELAVQEMKRAPCTVDRRRRLQRHAPRGQADRAGDRDRSRRAAVGQPVLQPSEPRAGSSRHYEEIVRATDLPILLYNIPQRTGSDLSNELLAELAQLEHIVGVKQANPANLAKVDGLRSTPATTTCSPTCSTSASRAGSSPAATCSATRCAGWSMSPSAGARSTPSLADVYRDMAIAPAACSIKAALNLIGVNVGGAAPAVRRARRGRDGGDPRAARAPRHARDRRVSAGTLRVLPLGGLGEIGKNMTVVEYDGRIVVVDTGLRFPTADMLGIDLVLPDFTLPARARRRHRGDRDHPRARGPSRRAAVGPARARRRRRRAPVYGGRLTIAMARSKLDEHKLRDAGSRTSTPATS